MKLLSYLTLLTLLAITGCAKPDISNVQVKLDSSLSPEKKTLIISAIESWKNHSKGTFNYTTSSIDNPQATQDDNVLVIINSSPPVSTEHNFTNLGYTNSYASKVTGIEGAYMLLEPTMITDKFMYSIVLHELGHFMFLYHYKGTEPSIMTATPTVYEIQKIDVQFFCEVHDCLDSK